MQIQPLNTILGTPAWAGLSSSAKVRAIVQAAVDAGGVQGGATATEITEAGLLDEVLSGVFWDTMRPLPLAYTQLCTTRGTTKARERLTSYAELDELEEVDETEEAPEDKLDQQHSKDFVPAEYKKKLPISRKLRDDLEWPLMAQRPAALARAALRTYDNKVAALINDSFAGVTYKGADGLSICNDAHVNAAGGNSQDNSLTQTLSVEGVRATRKAFREFTDAKGNKLDLNLDTILVPTELEQTAREIVLSDSAPHTTDRQTNIYRGNLDAIVWNKLTSTTKWWGLGLAEWLMNTLLLSRIPPEMVSFLNVDTGVAWVSAYLRFALGNVDWRGIIGNNP